MDLRWPRWSIADRRRDERALRALNEVIRAALTGDFTRRVSHSAASEELQHLADGIQQLLDGNQRFLKELERLRRVIGQDGRMNERANGDGDAHWESGRQAVNDLVDDLVRPTSEIARVITAVAQGDLSQKITVDARGEILDLKRTLNTMVDQLSAFADEVTRVAGEVGTEGKLGGQARVPGVSGIWADLTDNVNQLADNLTNQVRNIAEVTTAVARGDLSRKITVDASGEILELKSTINTMVDQLSAFADEVTRVAGEVGTEGKLGGQARVPGVSGIWADLTDNVNQLAANLTTQVRAIAEVSTAVTAGDLTRSINVEAQGEVAELKDNLNQMIANLRSTTLRNAEQDWLKTNLARIGTLLQGQRDLQTVADLIMSELAPVVSAQYGSFFLAEPATRGDWSDRGRSVLRLIATYGHAADPDQPVTLEFGDGLAGQAARDRAPILVSDAPSTITVRSGLGEHALADLVTLPILFEDDVLGVIELGSLQPFPDIHKEFLGEMVETIGVVLNTIEANMRTQELLDGSRSLTNELQSRSRDLQLRQDELRRTNEELQEKATLLEEQKLSVERKNLEIEEARRSLQEKAEQLALSSKYKSQFLANMSHELRTPMNSMLLMAELLADDPDSRMTPQQVEFAKLIRSSGNDLLDLIDDILDLSKIEAGRIEVEPTAVPIESLVAFADSAFRPAADKKGLDFEVEVDPEAPDVIVTDERRVQQILKNLLANAIKFTAEGSVALRVVPHQRPSDNGSPTTAVAFHVTDTGTGIPEDKLHLIFEAFQQADGSTNRQFGGTGLGLSISVELARLLDGEILVESEAGRGSTFTALLPLAPAAVAVVDTTTGARARSNGQAATGGQASDDDVAHDLLQGRRILVVDDDQRSTYALQHLLVHQGAEVITAEDGRAALSLLDGRPDVDAVLMDIMMPVLDGLEATRQLRKDDRFEHLPVIMLTAKAMPDDRVQSLEAGATDFVTKPVEASALLSLLQSRISEREHDDEGARG